MATMFAPAHSGSILKETLSYLKIRHRVFARKINISPDTSEQILRGKSPITFAVAQRIAEILPDPCTNTWVRMQSNRPYQPESRLMRTLNSRTVGEYNR